MASNYDEDERIMNDIQHSDGYYDPNAVDDKAKRAQKYKPLFFITLFVFVIVLLFFIILLIRNPTRKPFLTILQMNDVYELSAVAGLGGFPRIATIHKQLTKSEPNLITVLAGDFYSPSALGVAAVALSPGQQEEPLHGRQMVDVMNRLGSKPTDFFVTFGNHEYDVGETSFYDRIAESNFTYIATNVDPAKDHQWPEHVVPFYFKKVDGKILAFVSLSILVEDNLPYIKQYTFEQSVQKVKDTIQLFKDSGRKWDVLIGITHQSLADDSKLAFAIPQLDIIMGGHEHENWKLNRGISPTHPLYINKADSNAKTIFVHRFYWHQDKLNAAQQNNTKPVDYFGTAYNVDGLLTIESELIAVDSEYEEDETMAAVVTRWTNLAYDAFTKKGLDPSKIMCHLTEFINAQDKATRNSVSYIGAFLSDAFLIPAQDAYKIPVTPDHYLKLFSVNNIGSVRIDDYLVIGDLYQYDALRILPFGGTFSVVEMNGQVLRNMLIKARSELGTGMWMGYNPDYLTCPSNPVLPTPECQWTVHGNAIDEKLIYSVVIPDYVTSAGYASWFDSKDDFKIVKRMDIDQQHALIEHFERKYPLKK